MVDEPLVDLIGRGLCGEEGHVSVLSGHTLYARGRVFVNQRAHKNPPRQAVEGLKTRLQRFALGQEGLQLVKELDPDFGLIAISNHT